VIARLEGLVIEKDPPHVVIDCNGVGYDVICSSYTLTELPPDGERVTRRCSASSIARSARCSICSSR
jgi:Holliday junction resolvasome RuvABC DNA-binding subunit